jgi:hypothetical protein
MKTIFGIYNFVEDEKHMELNGLYATYNYSLCGIKLVPVLRVHFGVLKTTDADLLFVPLSPASGTFTCVSYPSS